MSTIYANPRAMYITMSYIWPPAAARFYRRQGKESKREWLAPAIVALVTFATFLPVLRNDFIDLDDYSNLVDNPHYRGLGWTQLSWMFTTFYNGHYRPLTWMTLGFDYLIWGMNPVGYHLTSLILHVANAVLFYFICQRLIALALPSKDETSWQLTVSAAFAALLFAVHPLRVETVALTTDRKNVLASFFFFCTVYCYLRAWIKTALAAFVLSLFSHAFTMMLPAALLILDVYPLRKFAWQLWRRSREKIPFVLVAVPFAAVALISKDQGEGLQSLANYTVGERLAQSLYMAGFNVWNTFGLYRIAPSFDPSSIIADFVLVLTVILSISFYGLRKRWPAALACWLYMIVMLAPIIGIVQDGQNFTADRYSYLACLGWPVLIGGLLLGFLRAPVQKRSEKRRRERQQAKTARPAIVMVTVVLAVLASLSWKQTRIWENGVTLYRHTPNSVFAYQQLGNISAREGNYTEAITHYRQAVRIDRDQTALSNIIHTMLGHVFLAQGMYTEAVPEFQRALFLWVNNPHTDKVNRGAASSHAGLAKAFSRQGEQEKANEHFRKAIELNPKIPMCEVNFCE
jgi:tetratricopeptide (TPR) repeat protein